jgi:hypothetical protein
MKKKIVTFFLALTLLLMLVPARSVYADVAPPQQPPGSALDPGGETQVRMLSEVVTISLLKSAIPNTQAQAVVNAKFVMRNLGDQTEYLNARFPLSDPSGGGDGFGGNPEIQDLRVKVNGGSVKTTRITTPNESGFIDTPVPWSSFLVAFPSGEDVSIEVNYTLEGTARVGDPIVDFSYILETGAGWKDTIGSADIIVHLPYDASPENIGRYSGFGTDQITVTPEYSGQEVRWHIENFEPDPDYNFRLTTVKPDIWFRVINETKNVTKNPGDSEAWGRLGKAYKDSITDPKGYFREDLATEDIFQKSVQAYEKAITLKPNDSLWHYGFADLLWMYYSSFGYQGDYTSILVRALTELDTSLRLDPKNEKALTLADWINNMMPEYVERDDSGYVFLALTQTPVYLTRTPWETPTSVPSTPTLESPATKAIAVDATPTVLIQSSATAQPVPTTQPSGSPICGGAALILPALAGVVWLSRRRRSSNL